MTDFPIVEVLVACGGVMGGMWAMFKSMQNHFLRHLERSEVRMTELLTTKNGHMERIANKFNDTIQAFQATVSTMSEKVDSIDKRV